VRPSGELRAFISAALSYARQQRSQDAERLLRSPYSGVSQAAALAILRAAEPGESPLAAISKERVAFPAADRTAALAFARALGGLDPSHTEQHIVRAFNLPEAAPAAAEEPPINLQAAAVPEVAVGLHARKEHFSASSLNTYVECRRKWFYRYLCAAVEDKGSAASYYGSAFHSALEELHGEFPRPGEVSAQTLRTKLQAFINSAFDRYGPSFETPIERELQKRRAQRTAIRYVNWLAEQAASAPFTVIGCELPAELTLEGFEFIGYIDRVDLDETTGGVTVIDYKTGAIARSAVEYREKVRAFKEFQLPFYYWARTAQGDRVSRLALVPLKDASLDVAPISLEVVPVPRNEAERSQATTGTISISDLERARTRMVEICRELTDGLLDHFAVTDDAAACQYCAYALACNARPIPPEMRFAR